MEEIKKEYVKLLDPRAFDRLPPVKKLQVLNRMTDIERILRTN